MLQLLCTTDDRTSWRVVKENILSLCSDITCVSVVPANCIKLQKYKCTQMEGTSQSFIATTNGLSLLENDSSRVQNRISLYILMNDVIHGGTPLRKEIITET